MLTCIIPLAVVFVAPLQTYQVHILGHVLSAHVTEVRAARQSPVWVACIEDTTTTPVLVELRRQK